MVNSFGNSYSRADLVNLAKYATNVPISNQSEKLSVSNVISYPLTIGGYNAAGWAWKNKGNYKDAFQKVVDNAQQSNQIFKKGGYKAVLNNISATEVISSIPQKEALTALSDGTKNLYTKAQKYAELAKSNPENKRALVVANGRLAQAKAAAYKEASANPSLFGKIKNVLGITKAVNVANTLATKSPVFDKCLNAYRDEAGSFMLLMNGGVEVMSNVLPTFKNLGAKKGIKQTGKSIVSTISSVAGWVAGATLGRKAGAVAGAAIGNSKAGAIVASSILSYVTGSIGQYFADKVTKKVLGKSEMEKYNESKAEMLADEAMKNPEVLSALAQGAAARIDMEGVSTPDSEIAVKTLQNIVKSEQSSLKKEGQTFTNTPMMSSVEMSEYAKRLKPDTRIKESVQSQQKIEQEPSPKVLAALAKADRVLKNVQSYVN